MSVFKDLKIGKKFKGFQRLSRTRKSPGSVTVF